MDRLSFGMPGPGVYALLGTNGAGKTTTIRHLLGFLRPEKGSCRILGMDCFHEAAVIQKSLATWPGRSLFLRIAPATGFSGFWRK